MKAKRISWSLMVLLMVSHVRAGWIIDDETTDPQGEKTRETIYVQNNRVKIVGSEILMVDLESDMIYIVIPEAEVYWSGTPEELRKGTEEAMKRQMDEALKEAPAELKEFYRRYSEKKEEDAQGAEAKREPEVEVKRTSERATVVGYPTQKYQIWVDGMLEEDSWISETIRPKDEIDLVTFTDLMQKTRISGEEGTYEFSHEYRELLDQGYPLKSVEYGDEGNTVTVVTKVEKKEIPITEFLVPQGYTRVNIQEMHLMQMMDE